MVKNDDLEGFEIVAKSEAELDDDFSVITEASLDEKDGFMLLGEEKKKRVAIEPEGSTIKRDPEGAKKTRNSSFTEMVADKKPSYSGYKKLVQIDPEEIEGLLEPSIINSDLIKKQDVNKIDQNPSDNGFLKSIIKDFNDGLKTDDKQYWQNEVEKQGQQEQDGYAYCAGSHFLL